MEKTGHRRSLSLAVYDSYIAILRHVNRCHRYSIKYSHVQSKIRSHGAMAIYRQVFRDACTVTKRHQCFGNRHHELMNGA
jgi:hypothetical protein